MKRDFMKVLRAPEGAGSGQDAKASAKETMNPTERATVLLFELEMVALFREMTETGPLAELKALLKASMLRDGHRKEDRLTRAGIYSRFLQEVYEQGGALGPYLEKKVLTSSNPYVRMLGEGVTPPASMEKAFRRELDLFTRLSVMTTEEVLSMAGLPGTMSAFEVVPRNMIASVPESLKAVRKTGYGIWAQHGMFRVSDSGKILPVLSPDPVTMKRLVGYSEERGRVYANVKALTEGKPAANMLLVGDAGTGKSSTVKAVCNELRASGIRLIELRKEQLTLLPEVIGQIGNNPLKFVLFIDDLSFEAEEPGFGALKAMLEGTAAAKTPNVIICATSNRRHIIKETFSAREGDEVHRRDTIEEQTSLSQRFGLTVLFMKPDKQLYLTIVHTLMEQEGALSTDWAETDRQAEIFAMGKGGRSARCARQFVDELKRQ